MPKDEKKKFHLTCPKTNLASLKIPTPSPPLRITQAPEICSTKTWNPETETETEYGIRERRFQAIDLKKKKHISNHEMK